MGALKSAYKDLNLPQLRTYREVCRLGSYAGAARQLGLTTSTVWEQVRGLERHFGVPLLASRGGSVRITDEGRRFSELLLPLLAGIDSAREVLRQERGHAPDSLTLVSGMRMLMEEVARALPRFRDRHPGVRLRLHYAEGSDVAAIVGRGEADLGLVLVPGPARDPTVRIAYEPAFALDYMLVAPEEHPLLRRRALRPGDLVAYPLVLGSPGTSSRRRVEEVLHMHGRLDDLRVAVETNSAALTFAFVRAGAGVGITAGHRGGALCEGLGVRPLARLFGVAHYAFVWPRGAFIPPAERALADLIRASAHPEAPRPPTPTAQSR